MNGSLFNIAPDILRRNSRIASLGEVRDAHLDIICTGIGTYIAAFEREFARIKGSIGRMRFLRGDFGTGKTFFMQALAARAHEHGLATAYVQLTIRTRRYGHFPCTRQLHDVSAQSVKLRDSFGRGRSLNYRVW